VAFRYEFSFAVGAVIAIIHDVLMTIGVYCLTGLLPNHGREFNATMASLRFRGVITFIIQRPGERNSMSIDFLACSFFSFSRSFLPRISFTT